MFNPKFHELSFWFIPLSIKIVSLIKVFFGVVVIVVTTTAIMLWLASETKQRLDIGYGTTTNEVLVRLEIGDRQFTIPRNYIWSREDWDGGKVTGVNIHALMPNFDPLTAANRKAFERPGWHRKLSFLLAEHAVPTSQTSRASMTRREVYARSTKNQVAIDLEAPFGLRRQEFPKELTSENDMFVGSKQDGSFYWVSCIPDGSAPSPACSTYIEYSKHVYIYYTFSKNYLSDWIEIEDKVLNLVKKFEKNTTKEQFK